MSAVVQKLYTSYLQKSYKNKANFKQALSLKTKSNRLMIKNTVRAIIQNLNCSKL